MTMSGWQGRPATGLLQGPAARGVLISASRDPDSKLTFVVPPSASGTDGRKPNPGLVVKIPATPAAGDAVEREGRMLVELRRMPLGALARTVPRYVESLSLEGLPVLVSTALPGRPMSLDYHTWRHTSRPMAVRRDLAAAAGWLTAFQNATARADAVHRWPDEVAEELSGRWDGHPDLPRALSRVALARRALADTKLPVCAVHGDFWFGNLLVDGSRVVGVVDWEAGSPKGCPLRDLARFALSYSLYVDRHTRPGRPVARHPGLRREGVAPGIRYALQGNGWLPDLVRGFLTVGLARLGAPTQAWYAVALAGIAEVAATANDEDFGAEHLTLLATLPGHARRHLVPR